MPKKSSYVENRIITLKEENSPDYSVEKIDLPLKESSLVQVGRGEHEIALQMATVGSIGMVYNRIGVESIGINVLHPNYIAFAIPELWRDDFFINGETASHSSFFMTGDLDSFHFRSKRRNIMGVTLPQQSFVDVIAALSGVHPEDIKLNDRKFQLNEIDSSTFKSRLRQIITGTCTKPEKHSQTEIINTVIGLLADVYLHSLPDSRYQTGRASQPVRIVRLAEECFIAAGGRNIALADLCAAAGVGKSALYLAFNHVCGMPPLAYFHKRRLMRARSLLVRADNRHGQVKQTAMSAGFTELGRFSVEYRKLFGESPSVTLSRNTNI